MNIFDSSWHFLSAVIILIASLLFSTRVGRSFNVPDKKGVIIYLWHTLFCLVYYVLSLKSGSDATVYYLKSLEYVGGFGFGTSFIYFFTSILSNYLGFSYLGCFLVYNFIGYMGLIAFYGVLKQATFEKSKNIKRLALLYAFLPSISFWSSAIGKDAISFMSVCFCLWSALNFRKRLGLFIFAVLAILMVRPHIAAVMLVSYALAFVFDKRTSIIQRLIVGNISLVASVILIPFAMQYAGLGDAQNTTDVEEFIDQRQDYNLEGGSSIDISSMSLPMQLFTYLFRPLPFEANSIFALAASFDNIILLFLVIIGILAIIKKSKPLIESNRVFLWLYVFMVWLIFATTTANLGIAVRQKWMFAPMLIFLLLSVTGIRKVNNAKVNNVNY